LTDRFREKQTFTFSPRKFVRWRTGLHALADIRVIDF
jgi:hypothetical protein